jgi:hypothetical protein
MGFGYKVTKLNDLPVVIVKLVMPPRLDVENLFREVAAQVLPHIEAADGPLYRINDMSAFDLLPIFSAVVRGLAFETQQLPGTSSDPRLIPIFVGNGKDVKLIVEALKQQQYGSYHVPLFPNQDAALVYIREQVNPQTGASRAA